jgi:hypothetical protein
MYIYKVFIFHFYKKINHSTLLLQGYIINKIW